jgi:hypothetical protein
MLDTVVGAARRSFQLEFEGRAQRLHILDPPVARIGPHPLEQLYAPAPHESMLSVTLRTLLREIRWLKRPRILRVSAPPREF